MQILVSSIAVLYAVAMVVLFILGINLLLLSLVFAFRERLRPGIPELDEVPVVWGQDAPAVTVQLPVYNEALVVERLINYCAKIRYPSNRLEIQVLDDSTDETPAIIARLVEVWQRRGVNIQHIRRTSREGFKAGALQQGLSFASGDLIAVFDADFMPPKNFLEQMIRYFDAPDVGMVQARWGHINPDHSMLTRIQAFALDAHFAIEHYVRNLIGCFINFNGTAGMWRRACIEDAGGWEAETLTEDLDLSYRAQLKGWRFVYVPDVEVPAELPATIEAFRNQQFRWTKGAIQTARKLLGPLWKSEQDLKVKLEGTVQLLAATVFPFVVVAALFHAPLAYLERLNEGPGTLYFTLMSLGLIGFLGFYLAQVFAQRRLYPDWRRKLRLFPLFMAGGIGISVSNTRAIAEAVLGLKSPFVRTPKLGLADSDRGRRWTSRSGGIKASPVAYVELLFGLYSVAGLILSIISGAWAAIPFQALFAWGFLLISSYSFGSKHHTGAVTGDRTVDLVAPRG